MTDAQITVAITVVVWIFLAGGLVTYFRMSIEQLKKDAMFRTAELRKEIALARSDLYRDINGLGATVRRNEDNAGKRYHNTSLAVLIVSPPVKEAEISKLLREGS
jgi:hypothetical protein